MRKLRSRKGQGMSEYLIILALVAIATIGAVIFFADNVREQIANITQELVGVQGNITPDNAKQGVATGTFGMGNFDDAQ